MTGRHGSLLLLLAGMVAACYGGPAGLPSAPESTAPAEPVGTTLPNDVGAEMVAWLALPIAPDLTPVSISHLSMSASEALDACWVTDTKQQYVKVLGLETVAGMAEVAHARAIPSYVPLYGIEPEIQTDSPAWVLRLQGEILIPFVDIRDPTCVVIDGSRTWFSTGASMIGGEWVEDPGPASPPPFRLPPLQP